MATKSGEIEIFQFHIEYSLHTLWVKNSVEIALLKMAAKSGEN